jgi:hypothetical protein
MFFSNSSFFWHSCILRLYHPLLKRNLRTRIRLALYNSQKMHTFYLFIATSIFRLVLATAVAGLPFTLRLAFRASNLSVVSSVFSSSLMVTCCPLDFASISFSSSLAYFYYFILTRTTIAQNNYYI